ncbi:MAG: SpaA isopeptide-forming pilin-related protein, partial [Oscillospiraceae bacterium]|nr:SpaA isopeptide-forming pilin-related protein [Oscillospiraceae bacterium]
EEYKGGSYITIAFDPVRFIDLTPGAAIVITYSARLNTAAVIGAPGNPNKVWLQYSNDPYTTGDGDGGSTGETPEDEVRAYTFDLDILKYDGNGEDAENFNPVAFPLPDAEFELSHVISLTEKPLVELVALEEDGRGNYRLAVPSDASADIVTTLVSDANGKIYIKGLDAGVYELEETKAPVGYHPGFITEITITHNGEGGYDVVVDEAAVNRVDIANYSGGLLPDTGGIGKIIFYAVSAALTAGLIVLAAIYVFLRKRKNRFSAG